MFRVTVKSSPIGRFIVPFEEFHSVNFQSQARKGTQETGKSHSNPPKNDPNAVMNWNLMKPDGAAFTANDDRRVETRVGVCTTCNNATLADVFGEKLCGGREVDCACVDTLVLVSGDSSFLSQGTRVACTEV